MANTWWDNLWYDMFNSQEKSRQRYNAMEPPTYSVTNTPFGDPSQAGRMSGIGGGIRKDVTSKPGISTRIEDNLARVGMMQQGLSTINQVSNSMQSYSQPSTDYQTNYSIPNSNQIGNTSDNFDVKQIGNLGYDIPDQVWAKSGIYIKGKRKAKKGM